jgi:hypothetical protein
MRDEAAEVGRELNHNQSGVHIVVRLRVLTPSRGNGCRTARMAMSQSGTNNLPLLGVRTDTTDTVFPGIGVYEGN